ncbi:MAG TPA: hypothetical protein VLF71_04005 [Candidatus Saccharimonadales bacterium]|nr:hypothetical protein [Candidatus Saccharimonadales bacterium]
MFYERYQGWLEAHSGTPARVRLAAQLTALLVLTAPVAVEADRLSHGQPLCPPAAETAANYGTTPAQFYETSVAAFVCAAAGLAAEPGVAP